MHPRRSTDRRFQTAAGSGPSSLICHTGISLPWTTRACGSATPATIGGPSRLKSGVSISSVGQTKFNYLTVLVQYFVCFFIRIEMVDNPSQLFFTESWNLDTSVFFLSDFKESLLTHKRRSSSKISQSGERFWPMSCITEILDSHQLGSIARIQNQLQFWNVLQAGLAGYEETREFQQDFESTTQESQGLSLLQDGKEWSTRWPCEEYRQRYPYKNVRVT